MKFKSDFSSRFRILKGGKISLMVSALLGGVTLSVAAPTSGVVTSGTANISQSGNTTNINQSSNKATINWQDFSIKSNETVNFNQPNKNSITLNRVVGNEKSVIDGALNANGQVWILNSNGTLFGKSAKVNTSGLLVTTKELSDEDFQKGNYNFKGDSKGSIENQGDINLNDKAYAVFLANSVINNGTIKVHQGNIHLIGASDVTLTLDDNSNISLKVNKGVLNSLVENNNLIISNGGNVYLTTNAKNELLKGVVNNKGIIEANSLDNLTQSEVIIFAHGGTANIDGTITAKGGFVETSGKNLNVTNNSKIQAKKWLLDPVNVTIDNSNGTVGNEKVGATIIQNSLNSGTSVTIQADNDINVNQAITYNQSELELNAGNNININKQIDVTGTGGLSLIYAQTNADGNYNVNAKVNLADGTTFKTKKGGNTQINWNIVNNATALQNMNSNKSGNHVVGSDIDLISIPNWTAVGDSTNEFTGKFDGLGHTISNLKIDKSNSNHQGLFGMTQSNTLIRNIGLENVNIKGRDYVGGLVGRNFFGTVEKSYVTGAVVGVNYTGGLTGNNDFGTIVNSYASGNVNGDNYYTGGLVGNNRGTIKNSYASSIVYGGIASGGLVGYSEDSGTIVNSFFDGSKQLQGSYRATEAEILTAFTGIDGWISGGADFEGYGLFDTAITLPQLKIFSTITPSSTLFNSGYGTQENPYTITNWTQLQNINNSNILTQGYYLSLINNLNSSSNGYMGNSGTGWIPIGNNNRFKGTFDGNGYTISDLYINRPGVNYIGLFGTTNNSSIIKNIGLKNVSISSTVGRIGGLVGENDGTIENSYVSGGTVGNLTGSYYVGGLVGMNNYGTIKNSYTNVSVIGAADVGGLAGFNNSLATIKNSYASGTVSGAYRAGGLVGTNNGTIQKSFYDKTKAGETTAFTGVTALTTEQMQHGTVYKTAGWDIVADSSLDTGAPVLKYDSVNNKYVWAIAPKTITGNLSDKSVTYNGLLQNLSSIYTSQAIFGTDGMNFKFVDNSGDIIGFKNAGTYSNIGVELTGTDEFTVAGVGTQGTLTINKANLDIVANSNSVVYNGNVQSVSGYEFGENGLLGSDTSSVFALTGVDTTSSSKNVGNYTTNIAQTGTSDNYTLNITQGKLEITKADLTITGLTADNKVYDGNTTATVNAGSVGYTGKIGSDDISINTAGLSATFTDKNAGTHNINLSGVTLNGDDANNYNVTAPSSLTATIAQKEVTIANDSIAGVNKTYDGTTNATVTNKGTLSGLVGSESLNLDYAANFIDKNAGASKDINVIYTLANGSYGEIASNYKIKVGDETTTTTADISKKDLTIDSVVAENKTYDGTNSSTLGKKGNLVGLVDGEELELSYSTAEFSDKNANDDKTVTVSGYTIANKGIDLASNYNLTQTSKTTTANINKANLTLSGLTVDNKVYNGNTTATVNIGTVGYTGKIGTDHIFLDTDELTGEFVNKNVGTHQVNILGVALSGTDANNYNVTAPNSLTATIAQKEVTIANDSIAGVNKTYDGTTNATVINKGTLSGFVGSETLDLDYVANFIDKNAGTSKNIDVSYSLEDGTNGGLASNYKIKVGDEITTTTADISKKNVTVVNYTAENKIYDGTYIAKVTGKSSDFIAGDKIGFTQTALFYGDDSLDANAGSGKLVRISNIALSGADSTNYNLVNGVYQDKSADITKKDLFVKVNNESKIYDAKEFIGGKVVYNGFVAGENTSVFTAGNLEFTGDSQSAIQIGKYDISAATSGFDAENYNIIYQDGVLNIASVPVISTQNNDIKKVINSIDKIVNVNVPINQLFTNNVTITSDTQSNTGLNDTNIQNPNISVLALNGSQSLNVFNGGVNFPINVNDGINILLENLR